MAIFQLVHAYRRHRYNDIQVAIPLSKMSFERVTSLYDLADSAYDAPEIKLYSHNLGHVPIIDHNPRRGKKKEFEPAKKHRYAQRSSVERVNGRLKDHFCGRFIWVNFLLPKILKIFINAILLIKCLTNTTIAIISHHI